jgi:hypothetical protein
MENDKNQDFPPNPLDKPGYRLEFHDEFESMPLDVNKWLPYYLPHWSNRELAAARYSLDGKTLNLIIEKDQQSWCPDHDGDVRVSSLQTGCFSGPSGSPIGQHRFNPDLRVSEAQPTMRLYTPQYGYFESRLKALPIPGYMAAFWMIGFEEKPKQSAEICISEIFGRQVAEDASVIGYGVHPFSDANIEDDFHKEYFEMDASDFHIYAAEWTPAQVDFFIDNQKTRTIPQSPQYPMQFLLGIYEIPDHLTAASRDAPWPKAFEVDYVRAYQPMLGY